MCVVYLITLYEKGPKNNALKWKKIKSLVGFYGWLICNTSTTNIIDDFFKCFLVFVYAQGWQCVGGRIVDLYQLDGNFDAN